MTEAVEPVIDPGRLVNSPAGAEAARGPAGSGPSRADADGSMAIRSASPSVQRLTALLVADVAARPDTPDDLRRRAQSLIAHLDHPQKG